MPSFPVETACTGADRSALLHMLGGVLRPDNASLLAAEQPALHGDSATGDLHGVRDAGEFVAGAATVARKVITPRGSLRIGLVGCVATDPGHRRRGLAASVLESAKAHLLHEECDFALLWADDPLFYQKLGWHRAGTEWVYMVPPLDGFDAPGTVRRYDAADLHEVERLRGRESVRNDRPRAESAHHYLSPGSHVYVYCEGGHPVSAYAAAGRGGDLDAVIHEYGGTVQGILACTAAILREHYPNGALLLASPHRRGLMEILGGAGIQSECGAVGMFAILNPEAAASILQKALPEGSHVGVHGDRFVCNISERSVELSHNEVLEAIMGCEGRRAVLECIETTLQIGKLTNLPVEPWFGGFDSI